MRRYILERLVAASVIIGGLTAVLWPLFIAYVVLHFIIKWW